MSTPSRRRELDVVKLMMSDYKVETVNDRVGEFLVEFHGPRDSPYQDGTWKVRVKLPDEYPYDPPSIRFVNRIFHPNIGELSGTVCLDVLRQTWSPMFDLINVFDVFLPQLLLYPNPSHPLNAEAAALMMRDYEGYEKKLKEHCGTYAAATEQAEHVESAHPEAEESSSDEEVSDDDYMSADE